MSSSQFPMSVRDLEAWLPHRAPMVWVDEVLSVDDAGGECRVNLNSEALYMDSDGIRQSSMVEWLAQSFGYVRGVQNVFNANVGKTPSRAFLAAVREAKYHYPLHKLDLATETYLRIQIGNIRELPPLLVFEGTIWSQSGIRLFDARLTVYSD